MWGWSQGNEMLDTLENKPPPRRNGVDGLHIRGRFGLGLANTNPNATQPSTWSLGEFNAAPAKLGKNVVVVVGDQNQSLARQLSSDLPSDKGWSSFEYMHTDVRSRLAAADIAGQLMAAIWTQVVATIRAQSAQIEFSQKAKVLRPSGQVALFKRIMADWDFNEREAAILLGFEAASDIREIYSGIRPVGHRDANDRLRALLRIATDLDALFKEQAAIRGWLNEPQPDLNDEAPRSLLTEGSMENLLRVKNYVAYLSGR